MLPLFSGAQEFEVIQLTTSANGSVYSPAYCGDKLVVCSDVKGRIYKTVLDNQGKEPTDLYILDPEDPEALKPFDEQFRTNYNDGPITFSADLSLCVVSRNQKTDQKTRQLEEEINLLGLYMAYDSAGTWSTLLPFPFNNDEYSFSHPALNETGDVLVFTSNMPGGFGGFDLWMSTKVNGEWAEPKNAGSYVNSSANELFPTFNNGFTWYFSSDRVGIGGLDIYTAQILPGAATASAEIMAYPFNTESDDFGLITRNGGDNGYLSSNRNGTDNIFQFEYLYPIFENCDSLVKDVFCYTLSEEYAAKLDEVPLVYEWDINGIKRQGVTIEYCFPGADDYHISLNIIDTVINETYYNQAVYDITLAFTEQPYIDSPDTVAVGEVFALNAENTNLPGLIIDHYFWDMGDGNRGRGIELTHQYDQPGWYQVQLGVIGYESETETKDCVYKSIYCTDGALTPSPDDIENLLPDQINNETVVTHVDHFGVDAEDSLFTVYSVEVMRTDDPLNKNDPQLLTLENFHVQLTYNEEEGQYQYTIGQWTDASDAHPVWREVKNLGFEDAVLQAFVINQVQEFPLNEVFVLEAVQFDSDSWQINSEAENPLKKILQILNDFPTLNLAINAHTDADGNASHNMELSINRANSVRTYLVEAGIDKNRLVASGFGETMPIDDNETAEGKKNNRRVEFLLLKN